VSARTRALAIGLGGFVACLAFCIALFAWLDIELFLLIGPAIALAIAAYAAYRSALESPDR
jgi:hypothetical protein